jgi:hypothetical protein
MTTSVGSGDRSEAVDAIARPQGASCATSGPAEDENHLVVRSRFFFKIAHFSLNTAIHPLYDVDLSDETVDMARDLGADIVSWATRSFLERGLDKSWHGSHSSAKEGRETIAVLKLGTFQEWWKVGGEQMRHVRNRVRKAQKQGMVIQEIDVKQINADIIDGIYRIYHDTPTRQGRKYVGYTTTREDIEKRFGKLKSSLLLGAYLHNSMIGFLHLILGDAVASVRSLVSLTEHMSSGTNNAMLASAIESLCNRRISYLTYARMGYQPGLDAFKKENGFRSASLQMHYLPLSRRGILATWLRIHSDVPLSPEKFRLVRPIYNVASRILPLP